MAYRGEIEFRDGSGGVRRIDPRGGPVAPYVADWGTPYGRDSSGLWRRLVVVGSGSVMDDGGNFFWNGLVYDFAPEPPHIGDGSAADPIPYAVARGRYTGDFNNGPDGYRRGNGPSGPERIFYASVRDVPGLNPNADQEHGEPLFGPHVETWYWLEGSPDRPRGAQLLKNAKQSSLFGGVLGDVVGAALATAGFAVGGTSGASVATGGEVTAQTLAADAAGLGVGAVIASSGIVAGAAAAAPGEAAPAVAAESVLTSSAAPAAVPELGAGAVETGAQAFAVTSSAPEVAAVATGGGAFVPTAAAGSAVASTVGAAVEKVATGAVSTVVAAAKSVLGAKVVEQLAPKKTAAPVTGVAPVQQPEPLPLVPLALLGLLALLALR